MLRGLYTRCVYSATLVNEFLRESTDAKLAERGISDTDKKKSLIIVPKQDSYVLIIIGCCLICLEIHHL
jgi:hypothetical protein